MLLRCWLIVATLPGCGPDDGVPACPLDQATAIEIVAATATGEVLIIGPGGEVPLIAAPQGGHIVLVGARLQLQTAGCQYQVNAALRDPATNRVIGLEQRPVPMRRSVDGWAAPPEPAELSDLANVAVCPTVSASSPLHGNPFQLEVRALDTDDATILDVGAMVTPRCADIYCEQECTPLP